MSRRTTIEILTAVIIILIGLLIGLQSSGKLVRSDNVSNETQQKADNERTDDSLDNPCYLESVECGEARYYETTAYCLNEQPMASGRMPYVGAIACPREISLGTKMIIQGSEYVCVDRLSQKYDYRLDIWMESCDEAIKFGKQNLLVEIINN